MKKTYEKPMVYFEELSFDTTIADMCSAVLTNECQTNAATGDLCTKYEIPGSILGFVYFDAKLEVCEASMECYHVHAGVFGGS